VRKLVRVLPGRSAGVRGGITLVFPGFTVSPPGVLVVEKNRLWLLSAKGFCKGSTWPSTINNPGSLSVAVPEHLPC